MSSPAPSSAPETRGLSALLLLVTALWGLNMTAMKTIASYFDPAVMATERAALAAAFMGAMLWWQRGRRRARMNRRQIATVLACAALMVYVNQILLSAGLVRTSATNASVAIALSPLVSSLMATLILKERLGMLRILGVALGLGGVLIVVLQSPGARLAETGIGDAMVVGSVVTFAIGGVLIQRLARETDALHASAAIYLCGTAMLALHAALTGVSPGIDAWYPGFWPLMLVLFSSLIATTFGNLAWNHAIVRIGVARVSLWFYWVPVFGVGFAAALLGESLSVWHGVGLAAVVAGTAIGTQRRA
ncbi:DMT family transporter [Variovorax sp. dw_954]|uniref:DMT family transporter n=1 Tax=Variovorax sp. dw_954 TaxID=2720078 RepID=UPI002116F89D|nr:DMT family transporter [Variovorax sp. dw_954]